MNKKNLDTKIKHLYFKQTVSRKENDIDRVSLAKREIETLEILKEITNGDFLHENSSVLDLGCGDQFLKQELQKKNIEYLGFDIQDLNLEYESLPIKDNSQDLIISLALIEHLYDPHNMLTESLRCLKKGGTLVISTPNWLYSSKIFFNDYTHVRPYTPKSLIHLINDIGFSNIYDFPNLRCKSRFAYTNRFRYFLANLRPLTSDFRFSYLLPSFLKGKSKGMFVLAKKI